jgi:hypothetical protein
MQEGAGIAGRKADGLVTRHDVIGNGSDLAGQRGLRTERLERMETHVAHILIVMHGPPQTG